MNEPGLNELEAKAGLPGLAALLAEELSRVAEPLVAARLAPGVFEACAAAEAARLRRVWADNPLWLTRIVARLCGAAPFLVPFLVRHPGWALQLAEEDLSIQRTSADYHRRLGEWLGPGSLSDRFRVLRQFKYYELARITVRDLSPELVAPENVGAILAELSHLADALLAEALALAAARIGAAVGPPLWRDSSGAQHRLSFTVLGLGKLGALELNYSSDVDLVYVFGPAPEPAAQEFGDGPGGLAPIEYFTRQAREFGRIVSEPSEDGFLYRVDLDLRPEGKRGELVVSAEMLVRYYELWAATWEKAAFMKARPVAGDLSFGWRTVRSIDPMIYRSAMDFGGVAAIRTMKEQIEQAKGRSAEGFNVKIGAGGIRDVEFVAQALQMLHGGRIRELRVRSAQDVVTALAQVGVLPRRAAAELLAAYRFLRRTENRIQMQAERQLYRLPTERSQTERLARSLGFLDGDVVAAFEDALNGHRQRVREIFSSLFDRGGVDRVLDLFAQNAPHLLAGPGTRGLIEPLAESFAHAVEASADPERAMNNLGRFVRGVGSRRFYYELLVDRPELVPRLTALFAASEYFSAYLARHPKLIEPIFADPNVLLLTRAQLAEDLAGIRRELRSEGERDDVELALDALRLFHHRALINVGLLDIGERVSVAEAEQSLTDIAEVCVDGALEIARREMSRRAQATPDPASRGQFLVVGMGKLASRELNYGSDLDVIFLYDVEQAGDDALLQGQEYFVRLAQKLIWALRARTTEGFCYDIDARLRPSGNQGLLVTSLASFDDYHATSAQVWERQALLRARPVAGSERLAEAFEERRRRILGRPLPEDFRAEIHRIRLRVESELAREDAGHHDFKIGRGGMNDVESVVQCLVLAHGSAHPELFAVQRLDRQIDRIEALGLLGAGEAATLRDGWRFLERMSSRLRVVENRSISDLDEERGDLESLARRLGYTSPQRAGGAHRALLDDYRRHTEAIRRVYLGVLGVAE